MDRDTIENLRSDDRLKFKALYNQHKAEFLHFGRRYNLDQDALADVYQEAFLALRKSAINGKLDAVKSSMKTYLFGIGKYMIFDANRKRQSQVPYEANLHAVDNEFQEIEFDEEPPLSERQILLRKYIRELGEKCRQVLTLFYYRGLNIKEIVEYGGYNNDNVVKAHKSRCLKALRQMMKK